MTSPLSSFRPIAPALVLQQLPGHDRLRAMTMIWPLRPWVRIGLMILACIAPLRLCAAAEAAGAEDAAVIAAVTAADDRRVAASITRNRVQLEAVFSDSLRYAHSNGSIDTKASYVDSIASGRSVYLKYDYAERSFKVIAPGVVLMSGRTLIGTGSNEKPMTLDLNFLAVWRLEDGAWRFVAWQSSRNSPPAAK